MQKIILKTLFVLGFQMLFMSVAQAQYATVLTVTDIENATVSKKINTGVSALLTEFNKAFVENRRPSLDKISGLSKEGRSSILAMWETAPFRCIETEIIERGLGTPSGYQVRNIPMSLKGLPEDDAQKDIAINFDKVGNIEDIYFVLDMHNYMAIVGEGNEVTDLRRRQAILNFVENFRNAYNRKDIELLAKVYSDDALIITGKAVKQTRMTDNILSKNGFSKEKIEYQVKTKKEYINSLRSVFKNNTRINVVFDDIEVTRHPKYDEIYGVLLKQGWNTTNYSDVGYLFLMIDFKDGENMMVHVRTWQPEKLNGRDLSEDEIFNLGQFDVRP